MKTKNESNLNYQYYSRKLGKVFDSLIDLEREELEADKKAAEKEAAAKAKKNEAKAVEDAYKTLNAMRRAYRVGKEKATQLCAEEFEVARKKYTDSIIQLTKDLQEAEIAYKKQLVAFNTNHPEGFHITLKDDDYETTITSSCETATDAATKGNQSNQYADWVSEMFTKLFGAL